MRLRSLRVQNLRSIRDSGEISLVPLLALVGENNTGKSNVLQAVEVLVSAGAGGIRREDFLDPAVPIVIKGTFGDLLTAEQKRWLPYLVSNELILEKQVALTVDERTGKEKVETEFHGYKAEPTDWFLSVEKIQQKLGERPAWAKIVSENGLPDYFLDGGKATKATYSKALGRYLSEVDVAFDPPDLSSTKALGLQSNVVASLPRAYLLPAITDYSDEIDRRSSSSTFRRLMAALSERILQRDPRFIELQNSINAIKSLLNRPRAGAPLPRIGCLTEVESTLTGMLQRVMPSVTDVSISVEIEEIRDLFAGGVSLTVNDGVETDVLSKGHGLQRCIVFTLLHTLILNERNQLLPSDDAPSSDPTPILLLVEEPELYIHPQLAKLFSDVLASFAVTDQVLYTTHSPLFVDASVPERVAIVSKPDVVVGTRIRTCDPAAFAGLDDRKLFQGFTKFNASLNELFFARRVLLVEGPEDAIAVTATLRKLGRITSRPEELEWTVIPCGGKPSIPFYQRVLNAFQIPYAVLHDLDVTPQMSESDRNTHSKQNALIATLAGAHPVHSYPVKLEVTLGLSSHFSDQYAAHLYFSEPSRIPPALEAVVDGIFKGRGAV